MKTKWCKVGKKQWARGPLRVRSWGGFWWYDAGIAIGGTFEDIDHQCHETPEAAMRAADRWAARTLKALKKLEGNKTRRKP